MESTTALSLAYSTESLGFIRSPGLKISGLKRGPDFEDDHMKGLACTVSRLSLKINASEDNSESQESRIEDIVYIGQQAYEGSKERNVTERRGTWPSSRGGTPSQNPSYNFYVS
jgi:hypothetical protein